MDLEYILKLLQDYLDDLQNRDKPSDAIVPYSGGPSDNRDYTPYYVLGMVAVFFLANFFFSSDSPDSSSRAKPPTPKVYNKAILRDKARIVSFPGMTKEQLDKLPDVNIYDYYMKDSKKKQKRRRSISRYHSSEDDD